MKAAVKMGKTTPPGLEGDSRGLIDIKQENQNVKDNAELCAADTSMGKGREDAVGDCQNAGAEYGDGIEGN